MPKQMQNAANKRPGFQFTNLACKLILPSIIASLLLFSLGVKAQTPSEATGNVDGHGYVDLGLSIWWATANVGGLSATDRGNLYAWGETAPKDNYTMDNSATYEVRGVGDLRGRQQYDAATAQWGKKWRMPTKDELQELIDNCSRRWVNLGDVEGYLLTSKVNGRSIFLPASGLGNAESVDGVNEDGTYWSSTPFGSDRAGSLSFYKGSTNISWYARHYGRSIRCVTNGEAFVLTKPQSQETSVAASTASQNRTNQPAGQSSTASKTTVIVAGSSSKTAPKEGDSPADKYTGHNFVDLGLSVRWATCNLGAKEPLDRGDFYAWGEIATKTSFNQRNSLTYGKKVVNGWLVAGMSGNKNYDAASANWGGSWRMPTIAEMEELLTKCKWEIMESRNGRKHYVVTSKVNGAQIILPIFGRCLGNHIEEQYTTGNYWSAEPDTKHAANYCAYYLYICDDGRCSMEWGDRDIGRLIRPVAR